MTATVNPATRSAGKSLLTSYRPSQSAMGRKLRSREEQERRRSDEHREDKLVLKEEQRPTTSETRKDVCV